MRVRYILLPSALFLIGVVLFLFGPTLLFWMMKGPDRLLTKEQVKQDYAERVEFIAKYKKALSDARQNHDVSFCEALPESISFYQTTAKGEVNYYPDYSGGPLHPGSLFSLPSFDCVRAYAVDFVDPAACESKALNDIQRQRCLMQVGHEMRRRQDSRWKVVCDSIETRDESEMCQQRIINPEKENLEIPGQLDYGLGE